jgi:hypothetical protein
MTQRCGTPSHDVRHTGSPSWGGSHCNLHNLLVHKLMLIRVLCL